MTIPGRDRTELVGLTAMKVVSWPDGDRVFLGHGPRTPAIELSAYQVSSSTTSLSAPAEVTDFSLETRDEHQVARLWVADSSEPAWEASCGAVSSFTAEPDEVWAFLLPVRTLEAIREAVQAVARGDRGRVAQVLRSDREEADALLRSVVDEDSNPVLLAAPPGDVEDWPIDVYSTDEVSRLYVRVTMCERGAGPTDYSTLMFITSAHSESPGVELEDVHVL